MGYSDCGLGFCLKILSVNDDSLLYRGIIEGTIDFILLWWRRTVEFEEGPQFASSWKVGIEY